MGSLRAGLTLYHRRGRFSPEPDPRLDPHIEVVCLGSLRLYPLLPVDVVGKGMWAKLVLHPLFVMVERGDVRRSSGLDPLSSRRVEMASSSSRPLAPRKVVICSSNPRLDLLQIVDAHE